MYIKQVFQFILFAAVLGVFGVSGVGECAYKVPNPELEQPEYWVNKLSEPNKVIMTGEEIREYNKEIQRELPTTVFDLRSYQREVPRKKVVEMLEAYAIPEGVMYVNGEQATAAYYEALRTQVNLKGLNNENTVLYGLTVKRANIRTFPTSDGVFESAGDRDFDIFQETAVNPAEPVIILHQSLDKEWFFVQTSNYRGWIAVNDVAVADSYEEWVKYIDEPLFLTVISNKLSVVVDSKGDVPLLFEMGAKIPLLAEKNSKDNAPSFVARVPMRNSLGKLSFANVSIPKASDVTLGYLPYTRANIIYQAFKFMGQPYGWGGLKDSVDCSSLTMDVYRTFGFKLPRNADEQEVQIGRTVSLENASRQDLDIKLDTLQAGATFHMDGHVMLYLGREGKKFYIIHSLGSYGDNDNKNANGTLKRVAVMKVIVSDLDMTRRNGKTFKESLTVAKNINW